MPGTLPLPARASRGAGSEAPRRGGVARWRGAVPFTARLRVVEPASAEPRGRDSRLRRVAFVDATMRTEARPQPSATSNQRAVRARQPHRRHRAGRPPGQPWSPPPMRPAADTDLASSGRSGSIPGGSHTDDGVHVDRRRRLAPMFCRMSCRRRGGTDAGGPDQGGAPHRAILDPRSRCVPTAVLIRTNSTSTTSHKSRRGPLRSSPPVWKRH